MSLTVQYYHEPILDEPRTVSGALSKPKWLGAMNYEYEALMGNGTWVLVPLTSDMNVITDKWVYKTKLNSDETKLNSDGSLELKATCCQRVSTN